MFDLFRIISRCPRLACGNNKLLFQFRVLREVANCLANRDDLPTGNMSHREAAKGRSRIREFIALKMNSLPLHR